MAAEKFVNWDRIYTDSNGRIQNAMLKYIIDQIRGDNEQSNYLATVDQVDRAGKVLHS
jgi:hypothetical protein